MEQPAALRVARARALDELPAAAVLRDEERLQKPVVREEARSEAVRQDAGLEQEPDAPLAGAEAFALVAGAQQELQERQARVAHWEALRAWPTSAAQLLAERMESVARAQVGREPVVLVQVAHWAPLGGWLVQFLEQFAPVESRARAGRQ